MKACFMIVLVLLTVLPCARAQWWPMNSDWVNWSVTTDARIMYVSTTAGNDATAKVYQKNDPDIGSLVHEPSGSIQAFATIHAAKVHLRNGFPDIILLKRGDTFTNQRFGVVEMYGRNRNERMQIGAYGSGARPRVLTGDQGFISFVGNSASFVAIYDIYAEPHTRTGFDEPIGVNLTNAPFSHFYVGNCHFHRFHTHLVVQDIVPTGPITRSWFWAHRNILTNAYQRGGGGGGVYIERVDTISFNGNLIHHNGWSVDYPDAMPTGFSHNTYFNAGCRNLWFYQNVVSQASAVGGGFRCGGDIAENVFLSNTTGMLIGSYDQNQINWPTQAVSARVRYNAVINPRPETFDSGLGIGVARARDVLLEGNLIARSLRPTTANNAIAIDRAGRVRFVSNTITNWVTNAPISAGISNALLLGSNINDSIVFTQNRVLQVEPNGRCVQNSANTDHLYFSENKWFSALDAQAWFEPLGSFDNWQLTCNEVNSTTNPYWVHDVNRDAASYMASIGRTATEAAFIEARAGLDKHNWNDTLTAALLLDYLLSGHGNLSELDNVSQMAPHALTVYPNPVHSIAFLKGEMQANEIRAVHAVTGEVTILRVQQQAIDFSHLPRGLYVLSLGNLRGKVMRL